MTINMLFIGLSMGLKALGIASWGYTLNRDTLVNTDVNEFTSVR